MDFARGLISDFLLCLFPIVIEALQWLEMLDKRAVNMSNSTVWPLEI